MTMLKEIGRHFDIGASGVSQTSRRIAMKISQDNKLREKIKKIENKLKLSRMKTRPLLFAIVRYDCSHGFLHRDVMSPGGKEEKYPVDIADLKIALIYAEQDIKDRWKWYRDRYRRRLGR